MHVKAIIDEDFINYKEPSMFICTCTCDFKCEKESGASCCQNSRLAQEETISIADSTIIKRYLSNPITKAICLAGLEPFDQFAEILDFITKLRYGYGRDDTVVIYTGYTEMEVCYLTKHLIPLQNIIIKFGRFVPNQKAHYDETLGVMLASKNQYAKYIS